MQRARMLLQVESRGAGARLCGRRAAGAGARQLSYKSSPALCLTSTVLCPQGAGAGTGAGAWARPLSSSSPPPLTTSTVLSPEAKARCLKRMAKMKPLRPVTTPVRQEAAVLVPLVDLGGEPGLLFTKRSGQLTSHRGQVSFPGGKKDPGDGSMVETALRETQEELGIDRDLVEVWGWMPALSSNQKGDYSATPVIGYIPSYSPSMLRVNQEEVAEVFTVPLSTLCDPQLNGYTQFRVPGGKPGTGVFPGLEPSHYAGYSLPVFHGGRHAVWGLTAVITAQLLRALVPSSQYRHRIAFQSPVKL